MRQLLLWSNLLLFLGIASCGPAVSDSPKDLPVRLRVPQGFPSLDFPPDNQPTQARIELGRRLFYHTDLSMDGKTHCGTCHVQSCAFTDGQAVARGAHGQSGKRNTPTLANLAWSPYLMTEGGVPSLELQALAPLHEPTEMGVNMMVAVAKINTNEELRQLNRLAYGRDSLDPYTITRALAAFQRTMISGDSKYDQYKAGITALSQSEQRGMELFFCSRLHCSECHSEPFFTDYGFYNIGLYQHYEDPGLERKTHLKSDSGKFKTPTLRNIAVTGPYMHDGSINTLEEVIAFYDTGSRPHASRDQRIDELHLSEQEKTDLLSFLETLTDWNFLQQKTLSPWEK
jgi:cytochrome c peroxidase